jgi:hypothetical protein
MAFSIDDLEALDRSIALGATTVQYSDRTVTYRSLSDMLRIRELMRKEVMPSSVKAENFRVKMEFSKGL